MTSQVEPVVVGAVSAGGVLGALARLGITTAWPPPPGGFPWSTWLVNVSGCFLIGVLLTLIARFRPEQRLLRPFLGVGVLGGYTTFSTAIVEVQQVGPLYLGATLGGALLAVLAGSTVASVGGR